MKEKGHKMLALSGKYTSPEIEELQVRVESGFAASTIFGNLNDFGYDGGGIPGSGVGIGDFGYDSGGAPGSGIGVGNFGYEAN